MCRRKRVTPPLSASPPPPGPAGLPDGRHAPPPGLSASVNVLAMMYLIEMLGWLHHALGRPDAASATADGRNARDRESVRNEGLGLVRLYLRLLQTALVGAGWSHERAVAVWQHLDADGFAREGTAVLAALNAAAARPPLILSGAANGVVPVQ